jgi:hypothetical protein
MRNSGECEITRSPVQSAFVSEDAQVRTRAMVRSAFQQHPNRVGVQPCPAIVAIRSLDNRPRYRLIEVALALGILCLSAEALREDVCWFPQIAIPTARFDRRDKEIL